MSHSQRRNYDSTPSNRYSRSSNYHDQDQYHRSSSKSHNNTNTKKHDHHSNSSRSHPHRNHDSQKSASQKSGTYGTYIYPLDESRRYVTDDPTTCRCNCCPHPKSVCKSSHQEPPPQSTDPYYSTSHPSSSYDPAPRKTASSSSHPSSSHGRHGSGHHSRSSKQRSSKDGSFVINVVDHTDSPLSRKYGRDFPITLSTSASLVSSILSFLAPDKRRAKIVVHWTDGEVETLGDQVPLKELKKYGRYLEVRKEKKKRVHWA